MKALIDKALSSSAFLFCLSLQAAICAPVHSNGLSVIIPMTGCGTGCMIKQKQLGSAYQDRKGIRKILVEQTFVYTTAAGSYGGKDWQETKRLYFLAECNKRKANFGSYSSNGTGQDDILYWVDVPYGNEKNRQFGPKWATYVQFDRICALNLTTPN